MIKEIRYKNFKALRDTTLPLGRFTLIVGANGTGKTTAIKAIEIANKPSNFEWKDIISVSEKENRDTEILLEVGTSYVDKIISWSAFGKDSGKEKNRNPVLDDFEDDLLSLRNQELSSFKVFSFDSDKIAAPVQVNSNIELEENGRGLAGVLDQLRDSDDEKYEQLNRELNNWFYEYERILFETPEKGVKSLVLRTKFGKHKIKAEDLSDGTRLALAYLTLAYLPNPPKIVAFEEPEKGIHPRLLRNIQEAMYRLAYPENFGETREPIQVIAITHSPYLLDLYKDHPEEIVIAEKDENGVHFQKLVDQPYYQEVIQDAPLGEVWFTGVLGGVPVQP
jgi:predicted ATPase